MSPITIEKKIMSEVEIYSQLSNSLSTTALFGIMWAFLLWVAGRSASVAIESDAGIIMKIAVTVFGLVSLFQFNLSASYVRFGFETSEPVLPDQDAPIYQHQVSPKPPKSENGYRCGTAFG